MKKILLGIAGIIMAIIIGSIIYISNYYHSNHQIEEYIAISPVKVEEEKSLITISSNQDNGTGIIFYPGGKVEYSAYITLLEPLAEAGYTCFIPKMPGNLAVLDKNRAAEIMANNKEITTWYLAGHSLGGAMSCAYAAEHSEQLEGLILLGAYPSNDLSKTDLNIVSIKGSEDGVLNLKRYEEAKKLLPVNAVYKTIKGGNHAHFGDYGDQKGDGIAFTSDEIQKEETIEIIKEFLE